MAHRAASRYGIRRLVRSAAGAGAGAPSALRERLAQDHHRPGGDGDARTAGLDAAVGRFFRAVRVDRDEPAVLRLAGKPEDDAVSVARVQDEQYRVVA